MIEPSLSVPFAALLRHHRRHANLTQRELAICARLSARTISDLERGIKRPLLYTTRQLADALNLSGEARHTFTAAARGESSPPSSPHREGGLSLTTTLPAPVSPFVGRAAELEALLALLQRPDVRLLTLAGPGGTGKTRLAIEAARAAADRFPGGVFFVPLASLADPHLVVSTIARVLGLREVAGQRIEETLASWLRPRHVLLVLDNLEHLVEAGPAVTSLLEACPHLKVLMTSRVLLHLTGEHLFPVPPLSLPPSGGAEPEDLWRYDATALFLRRATALDSHLAATAESARAIATLCTRLDGLPLAIELAAAQSRLLSPRALLERLESRKDVLGEGPIDAPARQRTLHDTMEWSHRLLAPDDQRLFARLSVFAGGSTVSAVQSVCGEEGDVTEALGRLVDATLIEQRGTDEPLIMMLETVREYAVERLRESGEEEEICGHHAAYYCRVTQEARRWLSGPRQAEWLERLEAAHDNLRTALSWLLGHDVNQALKMSRHMLQFWFYRGYWEEGIRTLVEAIKRGEESPDELRGRVMHACGWLKFSQGHYGDAVALIGQSIPLLRAANDLPELASALYHLGFVHLERGELAEAERVLRDSLESTQEGPNFAPQRSTTLGSLSGLARKRGDFRQAAELAEEATRLARESGAPTILLSALNYLGVAYMGLGDHGRADAALQEALQYSKELGAPTVLYMSLINLGEVAWERGDLERAQSYYEESLALQRALGDVYQSSGTLANIAKVLLRKGDLAAALERVRDGLVLGRSLDEDRTNTGSNLSICAGVLCAGGRAEPAIAVWAASRRILLEVGYDLPPGERALEEHWMERARDTADAAQWDRARSAGEAMTADEAVEFALSQLDLLVV